jgi:hypothetical protein
VKLRRRREGAKQAAGLSDFQFPIPPKQQRRFITMEKVEGSIEKTIQDVYAKDPEKWDALKAKIQKVRGENGQG